MGTICFELFKDFKEKNKKNIWILSQEASKINIYTVKKIGDGLKEVKTNLRFFGFYSSF